MKFSLLLTLTATSVILSSFAIALEPSLTPVNARFIDSTQAIQLTQPAIARDRAVAIQNPASTNSQPLTFTLPNHPGKRFGKLSFSFNQPGQKSKVALIDFNLPQTQAFVGKPGIFKQAIAIQDTWIDETGTLWVEFKSAVLPKTTLTIVFKLRNVTAGSAYEYGVAAYPNTKYAVPVFVGDGSLSF